MPHLKLPSPQLQPPNDEGSCTEYGGESFVRSDDEGVNFQVHGRKRTATFHAVRVSGPSFPQLNRPRVQSALSYFVTPVILWPVLSVLTPDHSLRSAVHNDVIASLTMRPKSP